MAKIHSRSKKKIKTKQKKENYHLPVRTEEEQFEGLPDELLEAWRLLRSYFISLGEQEVRTSHRSIMFARKTCYVFVRPMKSFLDINFFLPMTLNSELIKKVTAVSKTKFVHVIQLTHVDQVERPFTDWIKEAYLHSG